MNLTDNKYYTSIYVKMKERYVMITAKYLGTTQSHVLSWQDQLLWREPSLEVWDNVCLIKKNIDNTSLL